MTTLGFLNPKGSAGQSRLIFNLGWVLADAGFRVGLVDFDPQARLTELVGASGGASGSIHGALAPLLEGAGELEAPALIELDDGLWLARGHVLASIFDDALASAWASPADPRALAIVQGIGRMIEGIREQHELDVVLCDLGSSLGPLCHAVAAAVDAIVVPLASRASEAEAMGVLASVLRRWREAPSRADLPSQFPVLGFVVVRPSGAKTIEHDHLVEAYQRVLEGEPLGTIKEFPSLAIMGRAAHKPEIELTMADGAMGSQVAAVDDLRVQYQALATRIARASGLLDEDVLFERLARALYSELEDDLPSGLDALSSHTTLDDVEDIDVDSFAIRPGGLRITGSASVSVTLAWGGGEVKGGVGMKDRFPLRFDLELDRSHESVAVVHRIDVDTSSSYQ